MLSSTPLESVFVVIRLLAEGDDPYLVRDVVEQIVEALIAPGAGRPSPA